jgi:hypothetical protein
MNDIRKKENIEELRKRLYSREVVEPKLRRHDLTNEQANVATEWTAGSQEPEASLVGQNAEAPKSAPATDFKPKPRRLYRTIILVGSLLIFLVGAGFAAWYLLFSGNQISSDNIGLVLAGPSAIGGGEAMSLQVSVSNQNPVPIESATLIINYPEGARSVNETARPLFEERIPINSVGSGEVQNVPVRVAIFGEEGQEKEISATIEYRIEGSNGTFYKESAPLRFRITSTPLVLRIENNEKVAAGQMVEMKLVAQSNASNPLNNLLIQAEYPNGFEFEESFPPTIFGDNVWKIDELLPGESSEFTVRGIVRGLTEETFRIKFDVGPADSNNQYRTSSRLTEAWADFTIERPFINVDLAINGSSEEEVVLGAGGDARVQIYIENTLDETVYDLLVEVVPGGNALREDSIISSAGFYDSNSGTVRWEVANNPDFAQLFPGARRSLDFQVKPRTNLGTASFDLVVNVYARRIAETSAQEQLIGTSQATAKFSSEAFVGGQVGYGNSIFADTGPIPPQVGQTTTYTVTLVAEAGVNDLTDAVVTTSLPLYVNWLDNYQASDSVVYNTVSKQLEWRPGNIDAGQRKELLFQVNLRPSISQVNSVPTLVNSQQLRASDRFTGETLRATAPAITIALSTEAGFNEDDGRVVPAN